jgi:large subunit ribosomal protein L3
MSIGLLGQKIGMTSVYDANGRLRPVTVIAAGDNVLLRRLTNENEGYSAVQVGFGTQKESRVTKQLLGEFKKAGSEPKKFVREFRLEADAPEGDVNLSISQFQPGDWVDVTGRSKGKGFQGVMKKHNFHGQGAAHGSKTHRRNGAVGYRSTPGRIWKNMGMPGHLGDERVTVQNLQVMQVREAEKVILISGAVPGSNGSYVVVRPAIKKPEGDAKKSVETAKKPEATALKQEATAPTAEAAAPKQEAEKK